MKNIFAAAMIAWACSWPAGATGDHTKLLIDADSNLATANWKVSSAEWGARRLGASNCALCMAGGRKACKSSM